MTGIQIEPDDSGGGGEGGTPPGGGGGGGGTFPPPPPPPPSQGTVTLIYNSNQGNITVQGQLEGPIGRTVTLTAAPALGYAFSFWELEVPGKDITFGVYSGLGTINGRALPFTQTVSLGTVIPVSCVAREGYTFERAETFNANGQSLGRYLSSGFSVIADGQLDEVRVFFLPINQPPPPPPPPIGCLPLGAFCVLSGDCCSGFCTGEGGMAGTCVESTGPGGGGGPTLCTTDSDCASDRYCQKDVGSQTGTCVRRILI